MIKEYETTVSKITYYDKNKINEFLVDFREISLVGSLKTVFIRHLKVGNLLMWTVAARYKDQLKIEICVETILFEI